MTVPRQPRAEEQKVRASLCVCARVRACMCLHVCVYVHMYLRVRPTGQKGCRFQSLAHFYSQCGRHGGQQSYDFTLLSSAPPVQCLNSRPNPTGLELLHFTPIHIRCSLIILTLDGHYMVIK